MIKAGVINPDKFACLTLQGPASIASMRQWTLRRPRRACRTCTAAEWAARTI